MRISRTRLGVMMAIACFCFGCKGAGAALRVASVVAVTAARAGAVAAAVTPSGNGGVPREAPYDVRPVYAVPTQPQVAAPEPERFVVSGNRVLWQDPATGRWYEAR
jgi:hypothetical protein